jgi:hypothetical protein
MKDDHASDDDEDAQGPADRGGGGVQFAFYVRGFPGEGGFEDIQKPLEK